MRQATALKIIELLRKQSDKGFTILEISKLLKIGYRPAYNHVNEMQNEGILIVKTVGNAKQCFLNLENARCRHLLEEMDIHKKELLVKQNPKLKVFFDTIIPKLTATYISDIQSIILFGSYAKESATKTSDVDILFIVNDLKNKHVREVIERECATLLYSHNLKISPIITDITEFQKMLTSKELNVGREISDYGIALYGLELFWRLVAWQKAA